MKTGIGYGVYELNRIMGSANLALMVVELLDSDGYNRTSFDTEDDAIKALIRNDKTYEDYLIIKKVYLTK